MIPTDTVLLLLFGASCFLAAAGIGLAYLAAKVDPRPVKAQWMRNEFGRWTR